MHVVYETNLWGPVDGVFFLLLSLSLSLALFSKKKHRLLLCFPFPGVLPAHIGRFCPVVSLLWLLVSFCFNPWHRCISLEL